MSRCALDYGTIRAQREAVLERAAEHLCNMVCDNFDTDIIPWGDKSARRSIWRALVQQVCADLMLPLLTQSVPETEPMSTDVDAAPLDYGTIRAQRLAAEDVCQIGGCSQSVVARYGKELFDGAGMVFIVTARFCARHDAAYRAGVAQDGRIVQQRC